MVDYHRARHDGLSVAQWPDLALSPNEMHAIGVAKAGLLRLPATPELVFDFLAVKWRTIQHYGVEIDGLRYNGDGLEGFRNAKSPYGGVKSGKWPIRINPDDVRFAYFQNPDDGSWHRLDWEHAAMLGSAFSAEAAAYARVLAMRDDRLIDRDQALAEVLGRWSAGEVADRRERRMAARLSAERLAIAAGPGLPVADPGSQSALPASALFGDDDVEADLDDDIDDADGFYDDALEVLP